MDIDLLLTGIFGTVGIWFYSGIISLFLAFLLCWGSLSTNRYAHNIARLSVQLTRGIPTSIFVIGAGIASMRLLPATQLPTLIPSTPSAFQALAWSVTLAIAVGSSGHFAEIILAGRRSLSRERLHQLEIMGLGWRSRWRIIILESSSQVLPAFSARSIHHLHNTAFAALFPITELFGVVQSGANSTFKVLQFVLVGCALYITLSALIAVFSRLIEYKLTPPRSTVAGDSSSSVRYV